MTREETINELIRLRQVQETDSDIHEALGVAIEILSANHPIDANKMMESKIHGWVARDKKGLVVFSENLLHRIDDDLGWWHADGEEYMFPRTFFPDIKWEDEPIEIELKIYRI